MGRSIQPDLMISPLPIAKPHRRWRFPRGRIVVFARNPLPGQAKTRLIPALGAAGAARLQAQMIEMALRQTTTANLCPVELWRTPSPSDIFFRYCQEKYGVLLRYQCGANLGWRMHNAIDAHQTSRRAEWTLLIGSDCPFIDGNHLLQAATHLAAGTDAVLGPAEDGGYVLIGLRRTHPALFTNLPWGGDRVLEITRRRISQLRWRMKLLNPLPDIDRPEDLTRLKALGIQTSG